MIWYFKYNVIKTNNYNLDWQLVKINSQKRYEKQFNWTHKNIWILLLRQLCTPNPTLNFISNLPFPTTPISHPCFKLSAGNIFILGHTTRRFNQQYSEPKLSWKIMTFLRWFIHNKFYFFKKLNTFCIYLYLYMNALPLLFAAIFFCIVENEIIKAHVLHACVVLYQKKVTVYNFI